MASRGESTAKETGRAMLRVVVELDAGDEPVGRLRYADATQEFSGWFGLARALDRIWAQDARAGAGPPVDETTADSLPIRVVLDLELPPGAISGRVSHDGEEEGFWGWVGLAAAIERARGAVAV